MDASIEQLKALFSIPEPDLPSLVVATPARHAGWTYESTEVLLQLLRENHHRWHIFFSPEKFHNHVAHHLLAIYAMGANGALLKAAYATHTGYQRAAFHAPTEGDDKEEQASKGVTINETNWKEYLGDERYAYVAFFSNLLLKKNKSVPSVLEKFMFSKDPNIIPGKNGSKPLMLSRFLGGFLHPHILVGYGTEFNLPGMIVEGLAEAAVENKDGASFFADELWTGPAPGIAAKFNCLAISPKLTEDVHALAVLGRIVNDPSLSSNKLGVVYSNDPTTQPNLALDKIVAAASDKLVAHVDPWMKTVVPERAVLRRKFEELFWMNVIIYAVGGWAGREQMKGEKAAFNADFIHMHLVTSALTTASTLNTISLSSASLLLPIYLFVNIAIYLSRGRAPLPIADFYANTTSMPIPPFLDLKPAENTLSPFEAPNPWLPIMQTTLVHPGEHLCKMQRSLQHFAEVYGGVAPGTFAGISDLGGAEVLDGTLFIRAAGLTADRLGWMREGQQVSTYNFEAWDFTGFYDMDA